MVLTSSPVRLALRLARVWRANGFSGLSRKVVDRFSAGGRRYRRLKEAEDQAFDASGYDTGGVQRIYGMTLATDETAAAGGNHIAVPPEAFARSLAALDVDIVGFSFVDLGSGKGRAVLLAADQPFGEVVGVEFALELHRVAEANLARRVAQSAAGPRIRFIHGDAATFVLPDGPVILFLFNPFDPPVLNAVAASAIASWRRSPRPFRVIYLNPVHQHVWTDEGWALLSAAEGIAVYKPPE